MSRVLTGGPLLIRGHHMSTPHFQKYVYNGDSSLLLQTTLRNKRLQQRVKREKTNKTQQSDVYHHLLSQHVSGIIMPILRRTKTCVTAYGVLRWFCWMWLVAVVARYQPHPAEPAQYTTCSNTRSLLLKMGIMMPEAC